MHLEQAPGLSLSKGMTARGERSIKVVPAFRELEATAVSYAGDGRERKITSGSMKAILS
jgi:hypothetical protein